MASRTKGIGKYENVELAPIVTQLDTSGTDARQALKKGQEAFLPFIPEKVKEKTEIFNTLSTIVQELVTNTEVICDNCGWEWSIADGGDDLYICHKCGHDNNPALNESLNKTNDYKKYIPELTKYMVNQGMNIKPLPAVKFITNDKTNAENVFGKTAFYNPEEKSITLFTMNRHPKDVLRSFSHEMVHHMQNLENRLNNINTTNTNEDGDLPEIEEEAYKLGNMMLRTYEDSKKNK
jgi:hypothetical protein